MSSSSSSKKRISATIVVPVYNEGENLEQLCTEVTDETKQNNVAHHDEPQIDIEIIVVDDNSPDDTVKVMQKVHEAGFNARLIVRQKERGLSSAVLRGFDEAKGEILLCMDGDLQHPPKSVPLLLAELAKGSEFVLGTRYGSGSMAIDNKWPVYRRVISKTARLMARPLTALSDPMSGFFGISREAYERGKKAKAISPIGFKIAMELYVKCGIKAHSEVSFPFGVRTKGESKLSSKVIIHYLMHLKDLYLYRYPLHIFIFLFLFIVISLGLLCRFVL
eukprot:TRINITY_DN10283_c0_g1_i1.p1 TRINITY_DN10283_c0_g1~~TRINITY_DN10283_c0_g1_i1.p1  ORF type:complete len:289 (-),score=64.31 TRINITY_DN10283_c0_g1_i1:32-862(-)